MKEILRNIPNNGLGYGVLAYLSPVAMREKIHVDTKFIFNYLGQFDSVEDNSFFQISNESKGVLESMENNRWFDLEMIGIVYQGQLEMTIYYGNNQYEDSQMERFMDKYRKALSRMIGHCMSQEEQEATPSDFSYGKLSMNELDEIFDED